MPTNLPPQYFETERKLRTARTAQEKISIIEELLAIIPKHKGTEKLRALYKTKIAKLKSEAQKRPEASKHGLSFHIDKSGAGQVILLGPPNAGKSMLIKVLTNANPEVGDYPFTTRSPCPAMMKFENIWIQLVDMPPITPDYLEFWHAELIKEADAVLFLLDLSGQNQAEVMDGIRQKLKEKRIELLAKGQVIPKEEFVFYKKALIVANKKDIPLSEENLERLKKALEGKFSLLAVSLLAQDGLEELRKEIFSILEVIRVYSKVPGKKPDLEEPFILKKGSSVIDMAKAVHKDFSQKLKYARIWSKNIPQGQMVNRDYILEDEDIIELHI